ncbi:GNAT family N-acetyltransferase [Mesorhizobium sp. ANAO-SY3R2]|uniref:GNAT family N-acetyltransferase n=1 Tax=Mesorhizobium sp. ANAO-SY3R2 TaxID=3166644 RepID=UPI00366C084E
MAAEFTIRRATREDLPELLQLYRHLMPDDVPVSTERTEEIWDRFSRYGDSAILLGLLDGRQVATCTLVVIPNFVRGGANYALIENVVTHTDFRGQGHGKAVLLAAVDAAWSLGCYKVMLLTGSKNPATLGFYRNAGFETTKTGFEVRRLPPRER